MIYRLKNGVNFTEVNRTNYLNDKVYYAKMLEIVENVSGQKSLKNEIYNSDVIVKLINMKKIIPK